MIAELTNGIEVELETRKCANGCGKTFRCHKGSNQKTARTNCDELCDKKFTRNKNEPPSSYGKIGPRFIADNETRKASDIIGYSRNIFSGKRQIKIYTEGDFLYVNGNVEGVLYLEGTTLLKILKFLIRTNCKTLTKEKLTSIVSNGKDVDNSTLVKWVNKSRGILKRNFGGDWFVDCKHGWHLLHRDVDYVLFEKGRELHVFKPKIEVTDEILDSIRILTKEGVNAEGIAKAIGKKKGWVYRIRELYKISPVKKKKEKRIGPTLISIDGTSIAKENLSSLEILKLFLSNENKNLTEDDINKNIFDNKLDPLLVHYEVKKLKEILREKFPRTKWIVKDYYNPSWLLTGTDIDIKLV